MKPFPRFFYAGMWAALAALPLGSGTVHAESSPPVLKSATLQSDAPLRVGQIPIEAEGRKYLVTPMFLSSAPPEAVTEPQIATGLKDALEEPFAVHFTQDPEEGKPTAAYIRTANGSDLAEILIGRGLAEIAVDLSAPEDPENRTPGQAISRLKILEQRARISGVGRWTDGRTQEEFATPKSGQSYFVATRKEDLQKQEGHNVRVRGKISRIGKTPSGHITFLNFEGTHRGGFSGIIRQADLPGASTGLGQEFPALLTGKLIEITGPVTLYNESPQIEIKSPAQVTILR